MWIFCRLSTKKANVHWFWPLLRVSSCATRPAFLISLSSALLLCVYPSPKAPLMQNRFRVKLRRVYIPANLASLTAYRSLGCMLYMATLVLLPLNFLKYTQPSYSSGSTLLWNLSPFSDILFHPKPPFSHIARLMLKHHDTSVQQ